MTVYNDDAFEERVNFAANYISNRRPTSRRFDACFEMHDGDLVVTALIRRAQKRPNGNLATNLFRYIGKDGALKAASQFAHVERSDLKHEAAKMRHEAKIAFDKWLAEHQPA